MATVRTELKDLPKTHRIWKQLDLLAIAAGCESTEEALREGKLEPHATIEDAMTAFCEVAKDGIYAEFGYPMTAAEESRLLGYEK